MEKDLYFLRKIPGAVGEKIPVLQAMGPRPYVRNAMRNILP